MRQSCSVNTILIYLFNDLMFDLRQLSVKLVVMTATLLFSLDLNEVRGEKNDKIFLVFV